MTSECVASCNDVYIWINRSAATVITDHSQWIRWMLMHAENDIDRFEDILTIIASMDLTYDDLVLDRS